MNLDRIGVASPCTASWDSMTGDDRVRFCGQCRLNVYNLSSMTRAEAEELVRRREGRLCVRFYRREDGTLLTEDCRVGVRAVRLLRKKVSLAASWVAAFFGLASLAGCPDRRSVPVEPTPSKRPVMGEWCPAPTSSGTTAATSTETTGGG